MGEFYVPSRIAFLCPLLYKAAPYSAALRPLFNDFCSEQCNLCVQPCPSPRPSAAALLSIFSAFRASGRLFWDVYYLLFLSCIVLWIRLPAKRRGARLALIFLCLLQLVDLSPTLLQKHNQLSQPLTTSIQEKGDALLAALDGRHTLYFLEPNDDRALCGWLLRAGVSNNLPLISREGYGVAALEEERLRVQSVLLKGESPYPDCGYLTADPDLAAKLSADGKLVQIDNVGWLLLPAEGSQTSSE